MVSIADQGIAMTATEILTALLLVVTAFYAWATFNILKANQAIVTVMRDQIELQTRPYIQPSLFLVPESNIFCLRIRNIGKTAALDVQLSLDRDFYQFGEKRNERNLRTFKAFSQPIRSFPPTAELEFWLAQGPHLFGESNDESVTPRVFSVKAIYEFSGKRVEETTTLDLQPYLNSDIPRNYVAHEIRELKRVLEDLKRNIENLARQFGRQ